MIRTKAKGLLLSIMLIIACSCFFACKDSKVKVGTIAFEDQSISLLVGDTYSPVIKVLPRYASNKSYKLISSDTTALSVEGGTITALKPSTDVKLKVVSNEDVNINDVVSVIIYAEPIDLISPVGLDFDGEFLSFVDLNDSNVSSYELSINEQKINIGNNTKYSFASMVEKLGRDLYNQQLTCKVKAVGDNKIFVDSEYSEEIQFTKFSTIANAKVEDGMLTFDAIDNAPGYQIAINYKGVEYKYTTKALQFEIPEYGDINKNNQKDNNEVEFGVGEYYFEILPETEPGMFNDLAATLKYVVLGEVSNLNINGGMISWDFVKNAQMYDIEWCKGSTIFKQQTNFIENYITVPDGLEAGDYVFKIKAKSSANNTLQGQQSQIGFKILSAPTISAANNSVSWESIDNAEGYLVTITKDNVATGVSNKFVVTNTYDVSDFVAGRYAIQVVANGNGANIMSSIKSAPASWTILNNTSLSVANEVVSWQDVGAASYDFLCKANADGSEIINISLPTTSYDLSVYNLTPDDYTITVHPKGANNSFDAKPTSTQITKLANASIEGLANKKFVINKSDKGVSYKIEVDKPADASFETIVLENVVDGNKVELNADSLSAGEYTAKVFVYGNNENVFDADNDGTTYLFKKLETPSVDYEKTTGESGNITIKIVMGDISEAESYRLMQNGIKVVDGQSLDISNLGVGDYAYTVQAVGNNADILDSDITQSEYAICIKKLGAPTIEFDKNTLKYTIIARPEDEQCINNYNFTINGTEMAGVTTENNEADCSAYITQSIPYTAIAYAVAKIDNQELKEETGFDLVIDSNTAKLEGVKKIAAACAFKIEHSSQNVLNLIVEPVDKDGLTESSYTLNLALHKLDSEGNVAAEGIELSDFTYSSSTKTFTMNLYKNSGKYEVVEALESLLVANNDNKIDNYAVSTVISHSNPKIVSSDSHLAQTNLRVLDKVKNISKNGQTIEFDVVEGATNYIAIVTVGGEDVYLNLKDKYTEKTSGTIKNVLKASDLVELLGASKYREEVSYQIKFIALSDDETTITNKGNNVYSFAFLKKPDLDIVEIEGEGNAKFATIANNNDKVNQYDVTISYLDSDDTKIVRQGVYTKQDGKSYESIKLDDLEGYSNITGVVTIKAIAVANEGEYFNSVEAATTATKLDVPEITIVDGKLQWQAVDNTKQYNLTYSVAEQNYTIALKSGVENFSMTDGSCVYDCDIFPSGNTNVKLQLDASLSGGHYINSNTTEDKAVYKLPTLPINVSAGEITTKINIWSDLLKISRAEVLIDGVNFNVNISDYKQENGTQEGVSYSFDFTHVYMTLQPTAILKYKNMAYEEITIKLHSGNATTLNSSVAKKSVRGLLAPINLDILTTSTTDPSTGAVTEVAEKITWANQSANGANVGKYEVVVNYGGTDYPYQTTSTQLDMPNFGVGTYKIKVRALAKTDGNNEVVNSRYCDEITVTILSAPTGLKTREGNVIWGDSGAEYYLTRVYLMNSATDKTLISSKTVNGVEIDLTSVEFRQAGVYGVTVQAMSNDPKVLSSVESEVLQIIRLPDVTQYFVDDGELYIRAHKFYTKMELILTNITAGDVEPVTQEPLTIVNADMADYNAYIGSNNWLETSIVSTLIDDTYYINIKYENKDTCTLSTLIAEGYTIQVKLYGNSATNGAIVSNAICVAYNSNLTISGTEEVLINEIEKLPTPVTQVSPTVHGQVLLSIPEGSTYSTKYYKTAVDGELSGVHLYSVEIHIGDGKETNSRYNLFVADIVDAEIFDKELINQNGLTYFRHDNKVFNVIQTIVVRDKTYIPFNFNAKEYAYYDAGANGEAVYTVLDLSEGGIFTLSAQFEGDDSKYVKSERCEDAVVKRYKTLQLSSNQGDVVWENLTTQILVGDDSRLDVPIYIVIANNNSTGEIYNFALYNKEVYSGIEVEECLNKNTNYILVPIEYDLEAESITFDGLAKEVYKARQDNSDATIKALVGKGGVFAISIKAHHINGTATDVLVAQTAEPLNFTILPKTVLSLSNGSLTWELSHITTGDKQQTYIYNYLLKVYDTSDTEVAKMVLKSTMYTESNYIAKYVPAKVGEVQLQPGVEYSYEICAMPAEGEDYLKSMTSGIEKLIIHDKFTGLVLIEESGVQKLVWTEMGSLNVDVVISYNLDGVTITSKPIQLISASSYTLPESFTDTSGNTRSIVPGYTYNFYVRKLGDNSRYISGEYSYPCEIQKLSTIAAESIVTQNGVLTWEHSTLDGVVQDGTEYVLTYTHNGVKKTIRGIQNNSYSFDGLCLDGGEIKIGLIATHAQAKNSNTTEKTIYKLSAPEYSAIMGVPDTTTVVWDKVIAGNGAEINTYVVKINNKDKYVCTSNQWQITKVSGTSFMIEIKAISTTNRDVLLNGEYGITKTINMPSAVTAVEYDDETKSFEWNRTADYIDGDQYYISYQFNDTAEIIEVLVEPNEEGRYVYKPFVVGKYTNICVQIKRANSLRSLKTMYNGTYMLDLFASGDGGDNPYVITTETHLRNIKYFLNSKYVLQENITLTSSQPITNSAQVFSGEIACEDIQYSILGYGEMEITRDTALFEKVDGAVFKNLSLSKFSLSKSYTNATMTEIRLGILVNHAINTTFEGINITESFISLRVVGSNCSIYVGGIAAYVEQDSVFRACVVKFDERYIDDVFVSCGVVFTLEADSATSLCFGALAGGLYGSTVDVDDMTAYYYVSPYIASITADGNSFPYVFMGAFVGVVDSESLFENEDKLQHCGYVVRDINGAEEEKQNICGYLIQK